MPSHEVIVFHNNVPSDPKKERETGHPSPVVPACVAVCRECKWRGEIWGSAQVAVDEANRHRAETRDKP
jgi:hypothetical protein